MRVRLSLILLVALALAPFAARAVGVGVNPAALDITVGSLGQGSATLTITNPSTEPGLFVISPDEQAQWFTVAPSEVRLEAGESRVVQITAHPDQSGQFALQLSVLGYPLDTRAFKAASGLKVPVHLTVAAIHQTSWQRSLGIGLLVVAVIGAVLWYWRWYRRRSWWQRLKSRVHFW